jgi:hypothetical protein
MTSIRERHKVRSLLILLIAPMLGLPLTAQAATPHGSEHIIDAQLSGKDAAVLMALSCSEASWKGFAPWARQSGFLNLQPIDSLKIESSTHGFRFSKVEDFANSTIEVKIAGKNGLEVIANGHLYRGTNPCDLVNSASGSESAQVANGIALAAAIASGASNSGKKVSAEKLAALGAGGQIWSDQSGPANQKLELDRVINSNYTIKCSPSMVSLQSPLQKVIVRKAGKPINFKVAYFDKDTDLSVAPNPKSAFAKKAYSYYVGLALKCNNARDAEGLLHAWEDALDRATTKLVELQVDATGRIPASTTEQ